MHLLVAAHDTYPDPGSGGTGRYVYETARRLVDRGHRVSVITRRRGGVPDRETVVGVDVYRYDVTTVGESAPTILAELPAAKRTVDRHVDSLSTPDPPDLVSFQGPVTSLLVDRAVPDAVPRITTFHSPWPTEYAIKTRGRSGSTLSQGMGSALRRRFTAVLRRRLNVDLRRRLNVDLRRRLNVDLRRRVERRVLARSDGAITLSAYMRGQLRRVYGPVADPAVVPGGVDAERFTPDAGVYDPLAVEGPTFLTVRRLSERMGHDRLLAAFAALQESHPDARLFLAGDGPLHDRLERRAAALGVDDRTTFLGYVPDERLPAAYATADAFVLPTQALEGFGLATLEALASGTPVVATPVGGTVEVLAGLRGRLPADPLVASSRADAIADGMAEWAALDPGTREAAGETCRQYAREQFSWEQSVSGVLGEYERYLE